MPAVDRVNKPVPVVVPRANAEPGLPPPGACSPLCGEAEVELLRSYDVEQFCQRWQRDYGFDIRSEFRGATQFHLCRCRRSRLESYHPTTLAASGERSRRLQRDPLCSAL